MTDSYTGDGDAQADAADVLQLALLHSHGRPATGLLLVPALGCGLGEALAFGGELLQAQQWDDAELCRIERASGTDWQLLNNSRTLVCSINGMRVAARSSRALADGDVLEVGWLRFEVRGLPEERSAPTPSVRATTHDVEAATPTAPSAPAAAASTAEPAFDLRELAQAAHDAQFGESATHVGEDPFGVLDIDGAERLPTRDTLAELLGDVPPPAPARGRGFIASRPQAAEPLDLFDSLHEEFVRVVRDPSQLSGRADWDEGLSQGFEAAPSLEELSRRAARFPLVRDVLEPRESIRDVIDSFVALDRSSLLDASEPEDVLQLFAPAQSAGAVLNVPRLTRREHHGLSPDSYIGMEASRQHPVAAHADADANTTTRNAQPSQAPHFQESKP